MIDPYTQHEVVDRTIQEASSGPSHTSRRNNLAAAVPVTQIEVQASMAFLPCASRVEYDDAWMIQETISVWQPTAGPALMFMPHKRKALATPPRKKDHSAFTSNHRADVFDHAYEGQHPAPGQQMPILKARQVSTMRYKYDFVVTSGREHIQALKGYC